MTRQKNGGLVIGSRIEMNDGGRKSRMETKRKNGWIWYPGDFEIYHGMLQNFQREERGYDWPAYWKMADWRKNLRFSRTYDLKKEEDFAIYGTGVGFVEVNGEKHRLGEVITAGPGRVDITVGIGNMRALPCIYAEGETVRTDGTWNVCDFEETYQAGSSSLYTEREQDPNEVYYNKEYVNPSDIKEKNGGWLYDFGRMVNGTLELKFTGDPLTVCYGESEDEALDPQWCYYRQDGITEESRIRRRAFRFIFIPDRKECVQCRAVHEWFPIEVKAKFQSDDEEINRIWEVAKETYCLNSGLFFTDGIKRDRWIWSGDAYQSYFVNPYLFFDEEINKRTILALRGNREIHQHINSIVDYSMFWLISIADYYRMSADLGFVEQVYDKMEAMMEFLKEQRDENGFLQGRKGDWIFIDWAETLDKTGAVAAEQMLFLKCFMTMADCARLLGREYEEYVDCAADLKEKIIRYFWDEEKGAFIDSFESGRRNVTRHANLLAVLFDIADSYQTERIVSSVLLNDSIPIITTPYFKFFELDAMAKLGFLREVLERVKEYWGGMLKEGAVTFWEEYIPGQTGKERFAMYGDPYGKSLCHAWGASPIYLLGRYFLGVRPLEPGYETFEVYPKAGKENGIFRELDCMVPVKNGSVHIVYHEGLLSVTADRKGGRLRIGEEYYELLPNTTVKFRI